MALDGVLNIVWAVVIDHGYVRIYVVYNLFDSFEPFWILSYSVANDETIPIFRTHNTSNFGIALGRVGNSRERERERKVLSNDMIGQKMSVSTTR
jgi:hypothetical protein